MFANLCNNLNLLMRKSNLNSNELAKYIKLPASTIKKIKNDPHTNPTLATLLPIASYFNVSISQLIGERSLKLDDMTAPFRNMYVKTRYIPLLTWTDCVFYPQQPDKFQSGVPVMEGCSENAFALKLNYDYEKIEKDTILIVDPVRQPKESDYIVVHKSNLPEATLKQIYYDDDCVYIKKPLHGSSLITLTSSYRILGVVIELRKTMLD